MPVDKVEQRKQEEPDNIDEVPIEPEVFNWRDISRRKISSRGPPQKPAQKTDADHHVQGMHTSHREVQEEKDLCLLRHVRRKRLLFQTIRLRIDELRDIELRSRDVMVHPLLVIFDALDVKECQSKQCGEDQKNYEKFLFS